MQVADVDGVRIDGLLFDAGTTNSRGAADGRPGRLDRRATPATRPRSRTCSSGSAATIAGKATNSLVVNSEQHHHRPHLGLARRPRQLGHGRLDGQHRRHTAWSSTATTSWRPACSSSTTRSTRCIWNGNGGETIFFQNEMPYDPPNQAAWMNGSSNGYAAYKVAAERHHATRRGAWAATATSTSTRRSSRTTPSRRRPAPASSSTTCSPSPSAASARSSTSSTPPAAATPSNTTPVDVTSYP